MSYNTKVIRRDSHEENTVAVLRWKGSSPSMLLHDLRAAIKDWAETEEGKEALDGEEPDFNIGDFANCGYGDGELAACLAKHNIYELDIDVSSDDYVDPVWNYDTLLVHAG